MTWCERFYLEPGLEKRFRKIRRRILGRKPQREVFLLVLSNGRLELFSSMLLLQKGYPDQFLVVGLAGSRAGGMRLMEQITADMYEERKTIDYPSFFLSTE